MSFRPGDSKREEFRKYLEGQGLLDALTKALVTLYQETEKPSDAIQYLKDHLSSHPDPPGVNEEVEELKKQMSTLRLENDQLREMLASQKEAQTEDEVVPEGED